MDRSLTVALAQTEAVQGTQLGRSMFVDPRGSIVREASMQSPQLLVETIDLEAVTRQRKKFPWWRDARPDLYDEIVHPQ